MNSDLHLCLLCIKIKLDTTFFIVHHKMEDSNLTLMLIAHIQSQLNYTRLKGRCDLNEIHLVRNNAR